MPDKARVRRGIVGAAGRTAVALLRTSRRRAKLGSLHLPVALQPRRAPPPAPRQTPSNTAPALTAPTPLAPDQAPVAPVPLDRELRVLRSYLAKAKQRNARLRDALRRERLARERAVVALANPLPVIEHLVADLSAAGLEEQATRSIVTSVLGAYGFALQGSKSPAGASAPRPDAAVPGLDGRALAALVRQILADQPEIGSARYVQIVLETLASDGALPLPQLAAAAGFTSPIARRRLRLTVEALARRGAVQAAGGRYGLTHPLV